MTQMNTRVLLARRPGAHLVAADFEVDSQPIGAINEGQFLIKNTYLSMDAGFRQWMNAADREKIDYNLIEGFDQPWKRRLEGAMGAGWGVLGSDGLAKFALDGPVAARAGGLAPSVITGRRRG